MGRKFILRSGRGGAYASAPWPFLFSPSTSLRVFDLFGCPWVFGLCVRGIWRHVKRGRHLLFNYQVYGPKVQVPLPWHRIKAGSGCFNGFLFVLPPQARNGRRIVDGHKRTSLGVTSGSCVLPALALPVGAAWRAGFLSRGARFATFALGGCRTAGSRPNRRVHATLFDPGKGWCALRPLLWG